jgi:nucleotide-binding universal stress UspA family protein
VKTLLAIDGSGYSEAATNVLTTRMRPEGSAVLVVHAIEGPAFFENDAALQERRNRAEQMMGQTLETLRAAGFQSVQSRVIEGEPRIAILDAAAEWGADCIVLGSHGRTGLEKLLLGSVAQSVAQHAKCSVFIVRNSPSA